MWYKYQLFKTTVNKRQYKSFVCTPLNAPLIGRVNLVSSHCFWIYEKKYSIYCLHWNKTNRRSIWIRKTWNCCQVIRISGHNRSSEIPEDKNNGRVRHIFLLIRVLIRKDFSKGISKKVSWRRICRAQNIKKITTSRYSIPWKRYFKKSVMKVKYLYLVYCTI